MRQVPFADADSQGGLILSASGCRGVAKLMNGETAASNASIEAAKALKPTIAEEFARYGVQPPNVN